MSDSEPQGGRTVVLIDPEILDLVPAFMENRLADVEALEAALADGDLDATGRIGHSLKGMGGGYGFDEVTRLGAAIEAAAAEGDAETVRRNTTALREHLASVEIRPDPDA